MTLSINRLIYLFIFIALFLSSCRKDELPVPFVKNKNVTTVEIVTGNDYDRQVYFNLFNGSEVDTSHRDDWDLGFSCSSTPYIICNTAKMMTAMLVEDTNFEQLTDKGDFDNKQKLDHSTGRVDSLAIRGGNLFLIDRGSSFDPTAGFIKFEIIEHNEDFFKGRIANLDGSNEQNVYIAKNTDYNFVYLKWEKTEPYSTPLVEPKKTEWDIVFTQYGYFFYEQDMRYSVMGCLTNTYNTKAIKVADKDKKFEDVNLAYAQSLTLTDDKDAIGYDWKTYSFSPPPSGSYIIDSEQTYIIEDQHGNYYKLRFIGFQNPTTGEKGTPIFEYIELF